MGKGHICRSVRQMRSQGIKQDSPWLCWVELYSFDTIRALSKFPLQQGQQHSSLLSLYYRSSQHVSAMRELNFTFRLAHGRDMMSGGALPWKERATGKSHLNLLLQRRGRKQALAPIPFARYIRSYLQEGNMQTENQCCQVCQASSGPQAEHFE